MLCSLSYSTDFTSEGGPVFPSPQAANLRARRLYRYCRSLLLPCQVPIPHCRAREGLSTRILLGKHLAPRRNRAYSAGICAVRSSPDFFRRMPRAGPDPAAREGRPPRPMPLWFSKFSERFGPLGGSCCAWWSGPIPIRRGDLVAAGRGRGGRADPGCPDALRWREGEAGPDARPPRSDPGCRHQGAGNGPSSRHSRSRCRCAIRTHSRAPIIPPSGRVNTSPGPWPSPLITSTGRP